jgi:hypothetical protein
MSFLYLSGEKYRCVSCNNASVVKYQREGPYQVGDGNVIMQRRLKEKYSEPENVTLYIIEAVCHPCALKTSNSLVLDDTSELDIRLRELNTHLGTFPGIIDLCLAKSTSNLGADLLREYICRTISDNPPGNKSRNDLLSLRIEKLKERVKSKIYQDAVKSEEFKKSMCIAESLAFDLQNIALKTLEHQVYIKADTAHWRNLNPIVEYEMTIARLAGNDVNMGFYFPYNDELKCFQEQLILWTQAVITKIRREIAKSAKQRMQDLKMFLRANGVEIEELLADIV